MRQQECSFLDNVVVPRDGEWEGGGGRPKELWLQLWVRLNRTGRASLKSTTYLCFLKTIVVEIH